MPKDGQDLRVGTKVDAHALGAALLVAGAKYREHAVPRLPRLFLVGFGRVDLGGWGGGGGLLI